MNASYATSTTPEEREQQMIVRQEQKTALDKIKAYASMEEVRERFVALLGDREGKRYVESVVIAVANNENLQQCSPKSIMISAMRCASLGLSVDPIVKQAHLVPYGKEATLIVDYHGLVQLTEATGYYEIAPNVFEVYQGEKVVLERFSGKITIEGEPTSKEVIGWCGYFKAKNGVERWLYMSNEDADAHGQKYNPGGYNSKKSAWNTDRDKMRRKTVLRQLVTRWGKFSPHVEAQLRQEDEIIDTDAIALPSDENIQVEEKEPRPASEIMGELGFVQPEKTAEPVPAPQEKVEEKPASEMVDPTARASVNWAALQWNIKGSQALKAIQEGIASGKFANPMNKAEFKKIVQEGL